jgi:creatinine amidohydrolase
MSRLDGIPWPEASRRAAAREVLLVPLGSTEQHGPHLPVTTDTDIAQAVADRAAARGGRLLVAPPVAYGSSGEHEGFAGTLSIGRNATELLLVELGRSATIHFGTVVVVSTHGGNAVPVSRAIHRLAAEGHPVAAWSPRWGGDLHAGRTETSLMLAIAPERVAIERAEPGDRRPMATLWPLLARSGVASVSRNGVLGDPTGASAEEGLRLLDQAADELVGLVGRLEEGANTEVAG